MTLQPRIHNGNGTCKTFSITYSVLVSLFFVSSISVTLFVTTGDNEEFSVIEHSLKKQSQNIVVATGHKL